MRPRYFLSLLAGLGMLGLGAAAWGAEGLARKVAGLDRARIVRAAAAALTLEAPAVTRARAKYSEGGPHDFYSNGDYWWPDPKKPDGLPYIKRDGETNPGNFEAHRLAMREMKDAVAALAAAWALEGEERWAKKAAELVRVFFLDEATKMNPHLKYAQAIPGRSPGRGTGIIDTLHLAELPVALEFLDRSAAFTPEIRAGMKKWFADYLEWMLSSENGKEELAAENNHSVAYFVQVAAFARYIGDEKTLALTRERFEKVLLPNQMSADGSFKRELERTKPYGYSIFQMDNVATLAALLSEWKFSLEDGRCARKAVDFMFPYLADKAKWPYPKDVMHWEGWPVRQPALLFAYAEFGDEKYFELWKRLEADPPDLEVRRNMAITQPVLWVAKVQELPLLK